MNRRHGGSRPVYLLTLIAVLMLALAACQAGDDEGAAEGADSEADADQDAATDDTEEASADDEQGEAASEDEEVRLTFGFPGGEGHPVERHGVQPFVEEVEAESGGSITFDLHPGGALVGGPGTYENIAAGGQDLGWTFLGWTPGPFPLAQVAEMPFHFDGAVQATEVLLQLHEEFPEFQEEFDDVKLLGLFTHDIGDLWTVGEPVETLEDFQGLSVRSPGPVQTSLVEALGGTPESMGVGEVYDALERGVLDSTMVANSTMSSFDLFEVVDYGTRCNCYVGSFAFAMNLDTWESLSENQQRIIEEAAWPDFSLNAAQGYDDAFEGVLTAAEEQGVELIELDDAEFERWLEAATPIVDEWIEEREAEGLPGQEMYDRAMELVDE